MANRRPTASLLAWSLVGLLAGHQLAYLVVYRDVRVVTEVLAETGHSWLWLAPLLAASAGLMAMIVGFRGGDPVRSFRRRFAALASIQAATFLAVEACERLTGGTSTAHLIEDLLAGSGWIVLALGVALQVAVAFLIAIMSRAVDHIAAALRRSRTRRARPRAASLRRLTVLDAGPRHLGLAFAGPPRAPPARA